MADLINQYQIDSIRTVVADHLTDASPANTDIFLSRFDHYAADVYQLLYELYGELDDFVEQLEAVFMTAAHAYVDRSEKLKQLDRDREVNPTWYQHHTMVGAVCYVDQFAGNLRGIIDRISYFQEFGLTYLHLMPLYRTPEGPDDGGYAVSSYREVDPALGNITHLYQLADALRDAGINLVLDLVVNHTADNHSWALRARNGEADYQEYYFMFPDRELPDAYEKTLREIFPDSDPGSFTYVGNADQWVWTTFHRYQWDLNYQNPVVFRRVLDEMMFLANVGADVLRLDAVPFIWKEMGTSCENLPQAHTIIRAFNTLVRIAAPGMIFKSEAIVHPDDVLSYLGTGKWAGRECEISYNPLLMVELWEAMATGYTALLAYSMKHRFDQYPDNCAWVNYTRSHDDIGWGFANEDAQALDMHGFYHREFLNAFYTGEEKNSFAVGYSFGYNEQTQDMRISGTQASLIGLEKAINEKDEEGIELAVRRIALFYSIIMSMGGIPLIYLGDEIGQLNDYTYKDDPAKAGDSRWTHRGQANWSDYEKRHESGTIQQRIFSRIIDLINLRKQHPAFGADSQTTILDVNNPHVYGYIKRAGEDHVLALCNFHSDEVTIVFDSLSLPAPITMNLLTGEVFQSEVTLTIGPYEYFWLAIGPPVQHHGN